MSACLQNSRQYHQHPPPPSHFSHLFPNNSSQSYHHHNNHNGKPAFETSAIWLPWPDHGDSDQAEDNMDMDNKQQKDSLTSCSSSLTTAVSSTKSRPSATSTAASNPPPLIPNPPSQPLIIPPHVANALVLTR